MRTEEILSSIRKNKKKLFDMLSDDKQYIDDYISISKKFKSGNIKNDEFKEDFKNFYTMYRARLTDEFFDKYFELLERREKNLKKILEDLSKIRRGKGGRAVELSFATKLIHTIDNKQPIYDSNINMVFKLNNKYIDKLGERINYKIEVYNSLKEKFSELLKNGEIKKIISEFKKELKVPINNVKMLDFILWKLGELKKKNKRISKEDDKDSVKIPNKNSSLEEILAFKTNSLALGMYWHQKKRELLKKKGLKEV